MPHYVCTRRVRIVFSHSDYNGKIIKIITSNNLKNVAKAIFVIPTKCFKVNIIYIYYTNTK